MKSLSLALPVVLSVAGIVYYYLSTPGPLDYVVGGAVIASVICVIYGALDGWY